MSHHAASRSSKLRSVPVHVSVYSLSHRRMRASAVSAFTVSLAPTISTDITSNVCSATRSAPTIVTSPRATLSRPPPPAAPAAPPPLLLPSPPPPLPPPPPPPPPPHLRRLDQVDVVAVLD